MDVIINNIKDILDESGVVISDNLIGLTVKTCIRQIIERLNKDISKDKVIDTYEEVITKLVLEEVVSLSSKVSNKGASSITQGARSITFSDVTSIDYAEKIKFLIPSFIRLY